MLSDDINKQNKYYQAWKENDMKKLGYMIVIYLQNKCLKYIQ